MSRPRGKTRSRRGVDSAGLEDQISEPIPRGFIAKLAWYRRNYTEAELRVMGYGAMSLVMAIGIQDLREAINAVERGRREVRRMFPAYPRGEAPKIPRHKREHVTKPNPLNPPDWKKSAHAAVSFTRTPNRILIDWTVRAPRPAGRNGGRLES